MMAWQRPVVAFDPYHAPIDTPSPVQPFQDSHRAITPWCQTKSLTHRRRQDSQHVQRNYDKIIP